MNSPADGEPSSTAGRRVDRRWVPTIAVLSTVAFAVGVGLAVWAGAKALASVALAIALFGGLLAGRLASFAKEGQRRNAAARLGLPTLPQVVGLRKWMRNFMEVIVVGGAGYLLMAYLGEIGAISVPGWFVVGYLGVFLIVLVGGGITLQTRQQRQRTRAWKALGEALGLTYSAGALYRLPKLSGTYQDRGAYMDVPNSGEGRATVVRVVIAIANPHWLWLVLTPDRLTRSLARIRGRRLVLTGDPSFDRRFALWGEPPETVRQFVSVPGFQERLTYLNVLGPIQLRIQGDTVYLAHEFPDAGLDHLRYLFDLALEVAQRADSH